MSRLAAIANGFRGALSGWREARSATSGLKAPSDWLINAINGGPSKSGAAVSEATAFNVTAVRACISARADLLAMLPLKVYQRTPNGPVEQVMHPLSRLLKRRPNPGQTSYQWRSMMQVGHDLGGTGYSRIYRNSFFEVERIQWLKPCDVQGVYVDKATGRLTYQVDGESRRLESFEVLRVPNLSTNGYTGRSPLSDLREAVGLSLTAEEFSARTFLNGNRKPGIIVGQPTMSKEKAQEFLEFWRGTYAGAQNAGKTPMIFGGVDWKDMGFSNQDAELLMTRKFSVEEIARAYRLPLHLIGSTEKTTSWGSGISQLNQGLVDYTLAPLCRNWEQEIDTTLLSEAEQDAGYFVKFSVDALLRGDMKTRAEVYQIMRGIAAMDVNQIRALEDWEQYPDAWAGDPRQPLNNQGGGGAQPVAEPAATDSAND